MTTEFLNSAGAVLLLSGATTQSFVGTTGADTLRGTSGNDALRGLKGGDTYAGGKGDDVYYISSKADVVLERFGEGVDTVMAQQSYKLSANLENLTLEHTDAWYGEGNELDNILIASRGNQQLNGGKGNDVLVSHGKNNIFIVGKGNGSDVIYGFDRTDTIRLDGHGITSFSAVKNMAAQAGAGAVITFANGETLTLRGTKLASLSADNFYLAQDRSELVQLFSDEFNALSLYSEGGTWRTEYGWGGAGTIGSRKLNDEVQIYMDANFKGSAKTALGIDPFATKDGVLTITASPTPEGVRKYLGGSEYTSGLLTSKFTYSQAYGYFEIDAKLPAGQGFWPAFWLLPTDNSWPPELDIFEQLSKDPNTLYMTSHGVDAKGKHIGEQSLMYVDTTQWHTYGADWGPDFITYFVDGMQVAKQATPEAMKGKEMYMLINLAVGGKWPGAPDGGTAQMQVDSVRAYATENTTSVTVNGAKVSYNHGAAPQVPTKPDLPAASPAPSRPVMGTAGEDTLTAGSKGAELQGLAGNDVLFGGAYAATLAGGSGDDTYYVSAASQTIVERAGEGTDTVRSSISWTLGDNVERLVLEGADNINSTGNNLDNRLVGNEGNNVISGGGGNDDLDGGSAGVDTLIGGNGHDTYHVDRAATALVEAAHEGTDTVRSSISWVLGANFERLVLEGTSNINGRGNSSDNRIVGNSGNNVIIGGIGNDDLDGGSAGEDTLIGGVGDDFYSVNSVTNVLIEGAREGTDTVRSSISWVLGDNFENLILEGSGDATAKGNALANTIRGNGGDNVINGGAGDDLLIGNGGADTFVFEPGFGSDTVVDFQLGQDSLRFYPYAEDSARVYEAGGNTMIDFGGGDSVILEGVQISNSLLNYLSSDYDVI